MFCTLRTHFPLCQSRHKYREQQTQHKRSTGSRFEEEKKWLFLEVKQTAQLVLPTDQGSLLSCSALSAPKDSTFEESFPIQQAAAHGRGQQKVKQGYLDFRKKPPALFCYLCTQRFHMLGIACHTTRRGPGKAILSAPVEKSPAVF